MLSDVPDGRQAQKENPLGGAFSRGVRAATARSTSRARKALGDAAAVPRGPAICHIHDTDDSRRCGHGRGFSSPARKRVTKFDRQGIAAGDCSPMTASVPDWLSAAFGREVALSHLVAVGVSSSPANMAPPSAGEQRQRLRHRGGCVTPGAIISPRLPLRWQSGSLAARLPVGDNEKRRSVLLWSVFELQIHGVASARGTVLVIDQCLGTTGLFGARGESSLAALRRGVGVGPACPWTKQSRSLPTDHAFSVRSTALPNHGAGGHLHEYLRFFFRNDHLVAGSPGRAIEATEDPQEASEPRAQSSPSGDVMRLLSRS